MPMISYPALLRELRAEYEAADLITQNPPKLAFTLDRAGGLVLRYANVMGAVLRDGTMGAKVTIRDERTSRADGLVLLARPEEERLRTLPAGEVTPLRCALMAGLAIEQGYGRSQPIRLGLIGAGRLNLMALRVIASIWHVTGLVVRGSPRRPEHNREAIEAIAPYAVFSQEPAALRQCDVIISATNALNDPPIEWAEASGGGARLWIAQDSGYVLGPSFRQWVPGFSDHPLQLRAHWRDEFPHDDGAPSLMPLRLLQPGDDAVVYLYGLALADVVVARALLAEAG